jgi:CRISPR-associated protein Cas1
MRKLLNTLPVMTQGAYLHRDGETVAVKIGDEFKLRVPVHTLDELVCWGRVTCSPPVLGLCCERGVGISYLSEQGKFIARVNGPVSGNVLLRRQQYRLADAAATALPIVQTLVAAKIANSRIVLLRAARQIVEESREKDLRDAAKRLSWAGLEASRAPAIDAARGHEGMAGQVYFSVLNHIITGDREAFYFGGEQRLSPR